MLLFVDAIGFYLSRPDRCLYDSCWGWQQSDFDGGAKQISLYVTFMAMRHAISLW